MKYFIKQVLPGTYISHHMYSAPRRRLRYYVFVVFILVSVSLKAKGTIKTRKNMKQDLQQVQQVQTSFASAVFLFIWAGVFLG